MMSASSSSSSGRGRGRGRHHRGMRTEFILQAYHDDMLMPPKNLADGDKVVLHAAILQSILGRVRHPRGGTTPLPMIFHIRASKNGISMHVGVLEFTGDREERVYMPHWIMENLDINNNDEVRLVLSELEKVTYVRLKPTEAEFSSIQRPKETLEYALRKFTALTVGERFPIRIGLRTFHLSVTELRPSRRRPAAGCLIDVSLKAEFEEPEEKAEVIAQITTLLNGETVEQCRIDAGEHAYFQFQIPTHTASTVRIVLSASQGDPNLFVSALSNRPSLTDNTWSVTTVASSKILCIEADDVNAPSLDAWLYIAVFAYKCSAEFSLSVTLLDDDPGASGAAISTGFRLGGGSDSPAVSSHATSSASQCVQENTRLCNNCAAQIPLRSFTMHSLRCERTNWRCPACEVVFPFAKKSTHAHCPHCNQGLNKDELEKHLDLMHQKIQCACGMSFEPSDMAVHKSEECPLRSAMCAWCRMALPFQEKGEHENYCKNKTVNCNICDKPVLRKDLVRHRAAWHNINPCLDRSGDNGGNGDNDDELLKQAISASLRENFARREDALDVFVPEDIVVPVFETVEDGDDNGDLEEQEDDHWEEFDDEYDNWEEFDDEDGEGDGDGDEGDIHECPHCLCTVRGSTAAFMEHMQECALSVQ